MSDLMPAVLAKAAQHLDEIDALLDGAAAVRAEKKSKGYFENLGPIEDAREDLRLAIAEAFADPALAASVAKHLKTQAKFVRATIEATKTRRPDR